MHFSNSIFTFPFLSKFANRIKMSDDGVFHDEIEIEDFEYDEDTELFTYPCPCGDLFTISKVRAISD